MKCFPGASLDSALAILPKNYYEACIDLGGGARLIVIWHPTGEDSRVVAFHSDPEGTAMSVYNDIQEADNHLHGDLSFELLDDAVEWERALSRQANSEKKRSWQKTTLESQFSSSLEALFCCGPEGPYLAQFDDYPDPFER